MKNKKDHIKTPFKLDKLDKKVVYTVPDNYFNQLPGIIQSRVTESANSIKPAVSWSFGLKYALPIAAMFIMVIYLVISYQPKPIDVQAMLDEVSTEELIAYLEESELSTDELLSIIDLDEFDVDGLIDEDIELLNDNEWDEILEAYPDFENEI